MIFSDKQADGTVERKYIPDIVARPYPQYIASEIKNFMFHFATCTQNLNIKTDNSRGASRIFLGVVCNEQKIMLRMTYFQYINILL